MKGLLVKDLRIAAEQKTLLALMLFCALICLFTMRDPTFVIGYMCLICATLGSTTCAYDEMNKGMSFIMTLPYSRKVYVFEKYLFSLMMGLGAWVLSTILATACMFILKKPIGAEYISTVFMFLPPIFLIPGVMIPIILKFGHARSRIALFIIVGIVLAFGGILSLVGSVNIGMGNYFFDAGEVYGMIRVIPMGDIAAIITIITILFFAASMMLSLTLIKKKEY